MMSTPFFVLFKIFDNKYYEKFVFLGKTVYILLTFKV